MQLFLIRHAHASDAAIDAERPLSAKGRAQVKRLARFLRGSGQFSPDEIWHSPLVRAAETADLLARGVRSDAARRIVAGLTPDDDPREIVGRLPHAAEAVALVGHEPHLSAVASLLVTGRATPPVFAMKKCSVLALEGAGSHWVARWQISPDLLDDREA